MNVHPDRDEVFRTNARMKQTYDQIGIFYRESRIPQEVQDREFGKVPRGPDYGVVNFVELFSRAVAGVPFADLADLDENDRKAFYARFEHNVSDHMPIWLRIPLPD